MGNINNPVGNSYNPRRRQYPTDRREIHGESGNRPNGIPSTKEYSTWCKMRQRCLSTYDTAYSRYGGRGIKVCDRWLYSYANFLADMGRAPSPKHSIERNDVNGDYEPSNCRWATQLEQANNTRLTIWMEYKGLNKPIQQWCRELNLSYNTVKRRLDRGWSDHDALSAPVDLKYRHKT